VCTSIEEEASEKPLDIFKTSNKKGLEHLQTSSLSLSSPSLTHFLSLSLTYYLSLSPLPLPLPLYLSLPFSTSLSRQINDLNLLFTDEQLPFFKSDYVMLDQALRYLITGVKWLKKKLSSDD